MPGQSALLFGATGATGKHLLKELLASPHFTRVGEYGRRVTPLEQLASSPGKEKLEQRTIDFEKLEQAGLKDGHWDVVFITLGTTRAIAGSDANFEKIDREYVVNAAKAAKTDDSAHYQRLIYTSTTQANPKARSLYLRSKGLTELALARLKYNETIIFNPAMIRNAYRPDWRLGEGITLFFTGFLKYVSRNVEIEVTALAKGLCNAGRLGIKGFPPVIKAKSVDIDGASYTAVNNEGVMELSKIGADHGM